MPGVGPLHRAIFDDLEFSDKEISPLWSIKDINDEKCLKDWMENTILACQDFYRDFFQIQMDNLLLYKGVHWLSADRQANRILDRQGFPNIRNPRVVINHLYDFVTQWVSRLTRYRPAVAIYPARSEQQDADDAKIAKDVLDFIWYKNRIDEMLQEFVRHMKIFGEAFLYITWDPQKGDLHPDWVKTQQGGQQVQILDSTGKPVLSEKGDPMFMDKAIRIGDLDYKIDAPWHTFDQPCRNRRNIDWSIHWEVQDVEYLKAKYPDKADKIHPDLDINHLYTGYRLDVARLKNQIVTYELWHRSCEFMQKGRYIKYIKGQVLENMDLPYSHGAIPYLYLCDIDVPDQIRGVSFFQQLFPLQHQINAVASLIYKSLVLFAHPKIVMPEGAAEIQQLLNESTVCTYSGGVAPSLMANNPVSGELFTYLTKLEETAEKLSGVFTMSRGQAPSGVRAAKALRVLEEQEDKRAYITAIKYNNVGLVENAKMSLAVAGDFYDDSDGRLARIVGKDNEYKIRQFQAANLSKPYDIRIENTTALSQSPAARIDEITELMPLGLISQQQAINLLDLTASDEFKDIITRAARCAQSENDDILSGLQVAPPTETEDLVVHWKVHYQVMQSREYKEITPPERKAALEKHLYVTEYLMFEKANGIQNSMGMPLRNGSPGFAQRVAMECIDFPLLLKTPVPSMMAMGMNGAGPGMQMQGVPAPATMEPMPMEEGAPTAPPPEAVNQAGPLPQ
jgi:hypothetical protein